MRRTKIVCTMGPATENENVLKSMIIEGMDVARINFSHGTHEEALRKMNLIKKVRSELDAPVAILLDTKGPEIRIKTFKDGKALLEEGQKFTLYTGDAEGDSSGVAITYPELPKEVFAGSRILIDDGLIELIVSSVKSDKIICEVKSGGELSNSKGVNIPNISLNMPYMSQKDIDDILFGIENEVDFIAASFVRRADDVLQIRRLLDKNGGADIDVIAKIENGEGVENIDEILKVSDGIMVARGDMGVEIPLEIIPIVQKEIIKKTYIAGKRVITATQMLDSMIRNPRPTRAETTDVANAIYDGTSAIMLSGETAVGKYPVEAVRTMATIAERTEEDINYQKRLNLLELDTEHINITNALSHATCTTAHDLKAAAIIALTYAGGTARMISKFRPACPIIAATISERARRQLNLSWGVVPIMSEKRDNSDELFEHAVECALKTKLIKNGDLVVITGGSPMGVSGTTNLLKVHLVGHILVSGQGINNLSATGEICVADSEAELRESFHDGCIVVTHDASKDMISYLKKARGIICEAAGDTTNAAIVGTALDIPVITGAKNALKILKTGTVVTMDASHGHIYSGVEKV